MTVHASRVDWWLVPLLALPPVTSIMVIAGGEVVTGAAAIAGYALLLALLVVPLRYTIEQAQLVIRFGVIRIRIPWDRVIDMKPTHNPLSSPALSLRRLAIRYRKPTGDEASVMISPVDRAAFVADCATASPKHRAEGETLVLR